MKRFVLVAVFPALTACATGSPTAQRPVALLEDRPERPHEVIARVEARGVPGEHVRLVLEELQDNARELGADAVVAIETRRQSDATPAPYSPPERPLLGNAYPGPLHSFESGAFPPEGFDVRSRGPYYVAKGLAIRYLP